MALPRYQPGVHETVHWDGPMVRFGTFAVAPRDSDFETAGQISSTPTVVFPREAVRLRIVQEGRDPFFADTTTTVLYNLGTDYRRHDVGGAGDRSNFFHFDAELLAEALGARGAASTGDADRPFPLPHIVADATAFALQRLVVRHVLGCEPPDALFVEETLVEVLRRTLRRIDVHPPEAPLAPRMRARRRLAETARELLAARYEENGCLGDLATEAGCSVFHLCRVFRDETGVTLSEYRHRLRLCASLERVADGDDLSTLAADLGYASHSHFTGRFRAAFGVTPSRFRKLASAAKPRLKSPHTDPSLMS